MRHCLWPRALLDDHAANVDAHAKIHTPVNWNRRVSLGHHLLHIDSMVNGVHGAGKLPAILGSSNSLRMAFSCASVPTPFALIRL
jgi:hypothetical protein